MALLLPLVPLLVTLLLLPGGVTGEQRSKQLAWGEGGYSDQKTEFARREGELVGATRR